METHLDSHSMYSYIRSVQSLVVTANTTPQGGPGRAMDTAPGELTHVTRNEGSVTLVPGTKPTLRGNHLDEKHSEVGH